jgi:hypothetical protein
MKLIKNLDLQDALLLMGVGSLCGGIAAVYWPAALMMFGLICLTAVYLIERSRNAKPASEKTTSK